tara:strand:- start:215 stop:949 length:735 start_codon:yes stop_codon:yes gene_type:complete
MSETYSIDKWIKSSAGELETILGIKFNDRRLLLNAFIHSSYINEAVGDEFDSNERMEFLGDSILNHTVSRYLYERFPDLDEGSLTRIRSVLVNKEMLFRIATRLDIGKYLILGKGEYSTGGAHKESNLANTVEAIICAIYIDQGQDKIDSFLVGIIEEMWDDSITDDSYLIDSKSQLQQTSQKVYGATPVYDLIEDVLVNNEHVFKVNVEIGDLFVIEGNGSTKKQAEQDAAQKAIQAINKTEC